MGHKEGREKGRMLKPKSEISAKEIDAWTKRLETEGTCAQFASGLQVTPNLALEILRKNKEVRRDEETRGLCLRTYFPILNAWLIVCACALSPLFDHSKTLSAVAKARMILAICLVKRRVLANVEPLEKVLAELEEEVSGVLLPSGGPKSWGRDMVYRFVLSLVLPARPSVC